MAKSHTAQSRLADDIMPTRSPVRIPAATSPAATAATRAANAPAVTGSHLP